MILQQGLERNDLIHFEGDSKLGERLKVENVTASREWSTGARPESMTKRLLQWLRRDQISVIKLIFDWK